MPRILTTHVGSLPRSQKVVDQIAAIGDLNDFFGQRLLEGR